MEIEEREFQKYYNSWLLTNCGRRYELSTYDLINNCYEKIFSKERDVPIDEAEEVLYKEFLKVFSQAEWDQRELERQAEEERQRAIQRKLEIDKKQFHERLWNLPVTVSRNIQRFRKKQKEENELRVEPKFDFYIEDKWLILKKFAMNLLGESCMNCGISQATRDGNVEFQIDHVEPRSKFPEKALDIENLQVLCKACNHEKRNFINTDFRKATDIELIRSMYTTPWDKVLRIYRINDNKIESEE